MTDPLSWRYATKKFDPSRKIQPAVFETLTEALRLAPSSFGLQPWKFVIVNDPALREKIKANAWGQSQVVDASHLIVLCSLKTMPDEYIKDFSLQIAQARGVSPEAVAGYEGIMLAGVKGKSPADLSNWMKRQVYIALGMLLAQCAYQKIDSCPMEGFDPRKVDEILGLSQSNYESVVLCPVGYRALDDKYADLAKARFSKEEVFLIK